MQKGRVLYLILMYIGLLPWTAFSQTNLGRIVGTVRDSSGAVIPNATVTVVNEGTRWTREIQSGATGDYEAPNLLAGAYTVSVQQPGFKRFVRTEIVLDAGRTIRIDAELSIGGVSEEVRVEAPAPIVESETPSIASRVEFELQIKSAVSTGNRPWELLAGLPTLQSGANAFVYSIAGSRGAQNDFLIDGVASPSASSPLGSTSMTTGAAQELQVHAVNNNAEYSQPGVYEQISRSGSNAFHGQVRYFHSNSALNARSFFSPAKASSRDHQFGVWLGGPVLAPGLYRGRDKTFWMYSYEGGRTPGFQNVNTTVPTAAMRSGDFSRFGAIRDPLSGQPFPNNRIPAGRISPVSARIQDRFYPLPNFGDINSFAALNHRILFQSPGRFDHTDLRLDHKLASANTIYGRIGYQRFPVRRLEGGLPTIGELSRLRELWNSAISDTHIFRPTLINEARLGFVRSLDPFHGPQRGLDVLAAMGIEGIRNVPDAFGMPQVQITGLSTLTQNQQGVSVDQGFHFSDTLTWIQGRHTWKTGLEFRRPTPNSTAVPIGTYGDFNFTGTFAGNAYADFLLGFPRESSRTFPAPGDYRRQSEWGVFVQDDFKLSRRVTLQLGLRYDYQGPTAHLLDALYNFDPVSGSLVVVSDAARPLVSPLFNPRIPIVVADGSRFPRGRLWHGDRNNLGPRVGVAFRPTASSDFAVRAGYGVFYDRIGYGAAGKFTGGVFTPGFERFTNTISGGVPLLQFPRPFPEAPPGPSTAPPTVNAVIPNLHNPYVQQWNLTIEKAFHGNGLRASYIGTKGTQLLVGRNLNLPAPTTIPFAQARRPYPLYTDIFGIDQGGNSIYHALQLEAKRRFSSLTFNLGYVWANTISDAPDVGDEVGANMENPFDRRSERGREAYAIQHRFTGTVIWQLPVGRDRHFLSDLPAVGNAILGGWETIWTAYLQSGGWYHPTFSGADPSNTNTLGGRPDRLASGAISSPTLQRWFDPSAFAVPPRNAGRFGNSGRNILEGPGLRVLHLALVKDFNLRRDAKFTLEMAARNLFNHPNFTTPIVDVTNPNVARIVSFPSDLLYGNFRTIQMRVFLTW